ncbi:MAG: hypothetical protein LBT56_03280 [Prevotellaceae bacterium]|nr:hypothetical protein [Prevotellaceae bacterium]
MKKMLNNKKIPVRDYRSVEMINATPTLQFLPSDANLTACALRKFK